MLVLILAFRLIKLPAIGECYEDPKARREAHADWIYTPVNTYGREVDIVFESKMKELAILRMKSNGLAL